VPRSKPKPPEVVDSIEEATAPQMLWGRPRKNKRNKKARWPMDQPQYVYLFSCSFDPSVVIGGITIMLKERAKERGYGKLLWSCELPSRKACVDAERRFMKATEKYAVGDDFKGKTTWTEARRMNSADAITAWCRAIGKKYASACTTYQ
jgi:hypothetical protein